MSHRTPSHCATIVLALAVAARAGSAKADLRERYESVVRLFESFDARD
jgi:hypothetical protein